MKFVQIYKRVKTFMKNKGFYFFIAYIVNETVKNTQQRRNDAHLV